MKKWREILAQLVLFLLTLVLGVSAAGTGSESRVKQKKVVAAAAAAAAAPPPPTTTTTATASPDSHRVLLRKPELGRRLAVHVLRLLVSLRTNQNRKPRIMQA